VNATEGWLVAFRPALTGLESAVTLTRRGPGNRPIEFMTSRCLTLTDHETNKKAAEIRMQVLATTLFSGAMFFIDAVHPDGTVNPGTYEMIRTVYDEMSRDEPLLGGEAV